MTLHYTLIGQDCRTPYVKTSGNLIVAGDIKTPLKFCRIAKWWQDVTMAG
jgi:hypothetical protein